MSPEIEKLINETEREYKCIHDLKTDDFRKRIYEIEPNNRYLYIHKAKGFTVNYSFAQNEIVLLLNYFN